MMSRSQFPPIEKRSSSTAGSDLSGEITVDQFLYKYSKISSKINPSTDNRASNVQPIIPSNRTNSLRRTSIRRQPSSFRPDESMSPRPSNASHSPFRRSEHALLMTEHSSVLIPEINSMDGSGTEYLSTGDNSQLSVDDHFVTRRGVDKFQQSPSPDNRYGDKIPPRRRKSLLERWEDVQEVKRRNEDWNQVFPGVEQSDPFATADTSVPSRHLSPDGSSDDSQFDDDAYPYRPRTNTRGSSQETGFEPADLNDAAQRRNTLSPSHRSRRAVSSSGTEPSSACSDRSERNSTRPLMPTGSLFEPGNVERMDDVIQAMLSAKPPPMADILVRQKTSGTNFHSEAVDWDQADRASKPVQDKVKFPEPKRPVSRQDAQNEYELYGSSRSSAEPRSSNSHTLVMERLSQVMSSHRQRASAAQTAPHKTDSGPVTTSLSASPKPPIGRAKGAVPSPRPLGARFPSASKPITRASDPSGRSPRLLSHQPLERPRPSPGRNSALYGALLAATASSAVTTTASGATTPQLPVEPTSCSSSSTSSLEMITCLDDTRQEASEAWGQPAEVLPCHAGRSTASSKTNESSEHERGVVRFAEARTNDSGERLMERVATSHSPGDTAAIDVCSAIRHDGPAEAEGDQDAVDANMTQLLVWRQVLRWTAVSSALLTFLALLIFLGVVLL